MKKKLKKPEQGIHLLMTPEVKNSHPQTREEWEIFEFIMEGIIQNIL